MRRWLTVVLVVVSLFATLACDDNGEDSSAGAASGLTPSPTSPIVQPLIDLEVAMGCLDDAWRAKQARFGAEPLTYVDDYYLFIIRRGGPRAVLDRAEVYVSWEGWERDYSQQTGLSPFRDTSYPFAEAEAYEDAAYIECYEQRTGQRLEGRPW